MNDLSANQKTEHEFAAFVAIDWADQKHAFTLQLAGQKKKERGTLEQKPEVIGQWVAELRARFGGRPVAVALEQSRGALIHEARREKTTRKPERLFVSYLSSA